MAGVPRAHLPSHHSRRLAVHDNPITLTFPCCCLLILDACLCRRCLTPPGSVTLPNAEAMCERPAPT